MSSVKTAHRLPPRHAIDPEPTGLPWWQIVLSAVGVVLVCWVFAVLVGAL